MICCVGNFDESKKEKKRREGNNSKFVPLRPDYYEILILLRNNPEKTVNFVLLSENE